MLSERPGGALRQVQGHCSGASELRIACANGTFSPVSQAFAMRSERPRVHRRVFCTGPQWSGAPGCCFALFNFFSLFACDQRSFSAPIVSGLQAAKHSAVAAAQFGMGFLTGWLQHPAGERFIKSVGAAVGCSPAVRRAGYSHSHSHPSVNLNKVWFNL